RASRQCGQPPVVSDEASSGSEWEMRDGRGAQATLGRLPSGGKSISLAALLTPEVYLPHGESEGEGADLNMRAHEGKTSNPDDRSALPAQRDGPSYVLR